MAKYERAPAGKRIQQARLRASVPSNALAAALQVSIEAYNDLEAYDDDAFMSISLLQLGTLADQLRVRPHDLVAPPDTPPPIPVSMESLIESVRADIVRKAETPSSFSERVGWDVSSALDQPQHAWRDWNLDCLQDVCRSVGFEWLAVMAAWPGRPTV